MTYVTVAASEASLCRDSEPLASVFNNFESTDGNRSRWKYAKNKVTVYPVVYHDETSPKNADKVH